MRNAPLTRKKKKNILLTFLLLLALPIFVYGLLENSSFDFRNKAFEDIELSESNPCIITFPNVNPYSLEINSTVRVQVDALSQAFFVKDINISDNMGNILLAKEYTDSPKTVTESFPFTPQTEKAYNLSGSMTDTNNQSYVCVISSPYDIKGVRAITTNTKPQFTTTPRASIPSQNIQTGVTYEYTVQAEDIDKDTINYAYSFTVGEDWLKPTVLEDGGNGKLSIKLKGSTNKAGSYLANIFIHDGYSTHLSSQSWVISVSPKENSNPSVKIIEPVSPVEIKDNTVLKVRWEGEDDSQIIKYEIYISSNPTNENTWKTINKNINPSITSYNIDFKDITDGAYRVIVRAVDNQIPAGMGMDISEEILISKQAPKPPKPDDQIVLPQPQVINMSPTSTDTLSNPLPTIKASLVSSEGATINESSILVKIDNKDITQDIKINKISESEYTVIYIPEQPLTYGLHKVDLTFEDSNKTSVQKSWTFTIEGGEEQEDSDYFNIFGFEIAKRTLFIVIGGLGLIVLAIIIPMIIVAIWKDGSKESEPNNYALPQSVPPTTEIPIEQRQTQDLQDLVKHDFQAPEPELPTPTQGNIPEPIIEEQITTPPEPEEDLDSLYKQIEAVKQEENNNSK
ncbi:hypothetical protein A2400_01450 [candidate division WS6 bacterium RIFOXYB1_FULL_33_14]|uniref:Fibronectin type-III domain-containing protein n=1 Tax=candidate division WS6 bacterium RIFOXYB1_FULL_33_14 TaxID=1817896 RepID=A0A1F4UJ26_9BACT|nr:MAG: hypothetical protein A2400_01450 [candidate division WS6 bacterium RIFOXYB1_FULL_33_14]